MRSGDVEKNPGPRPGDRRETNCKDPSVTVTSYNVRGLNDENKMRHLINRIYKEDGGKNVDSIVCLQETYITRAGRIPFLWRGNFHLTPGTGSSCGCLTLISPHLNVAHAEDVDNRAQVLVCQRTGGNNAAYVVANIYAPNPNNAEKLEFFENLFDKVLELLERYGGSHVILAGDFNLIFKPSEAKNRRFSAQEKRVADYVRERYDSLELADSWSDKSAFTWRRPNTDIFSTIDRILYSIDTMELVSIKEDWSFGFSDHAAVKASYSFKAKENLQRSKITRLDPSLAKSGHFRPLIEQGFNSLMETMPLEWNPHLKLEFAKMCIRTVVEKIQAERKRQEVADEECLNEELDTAIKQLSSGQGNREGDLIDYIEELRARKQTMVDEKGARLAEKLGTKWFNEGEKSSKYFMRLLNRSLPDNFELLQGEDGEIVTEPKEIEEKIVNFYKKLYEDPRDFNTINDDEFFDLIEPISGNDDANVTTKLTTADLRATLSTCKDSAPGPDGIPYSYIEILWPTFGKILCEAWQYSLARNILPPSHKNSFLKLIPKAGKDTSKLTNWGPITLSNCDHKLITKTYARKLSEKVATVIGGNQTAYLKGRLINDNIRAILATINLTNWEEISGLIVSLDAKKAFDSVEHSYIEKCLTKFGCKKFVPIFRTLYKDLQTDIIINGRIVKGFKINRGVKQGDALSCILFIMCMEPLIRNINANRDIVSIQSNLLNCQLPKTYAYADDVNCIMVDNAAALKALFKEYEKLTRASGLELNADKTEIMRLGNEEVASYTVQYKAAEHRINSLNEIKINGILFQRDLNALLERNIESIVTKMDRQFKSWNRRNLSTLGKILIAKTFGISQAIYLMQSVNLDDVHFKKINAVLYKFIWNKQYMAAKAPERVKREIVTRDIRNGGYGMLDVKELDASLKIRALGRILSSEHPFLKILKDKLNLESFFNPKINLNVNIDSVLTKGIELLKEDRDRLWADERLNRDRRLLAAIRDTSIKEVVKLRGHNSIQFFNLWHRGARKVADISVNELHSLRRHVDGQKINKLESAIRINTGPRDSSLNETYCIGTAHKTLSSVSSKEVRLSRSNKNPIVDLKIGTRLSVAEGKSWGMNLAKLTSTKHKNIILRVAHGDIYTQSKLFRFGMSGSDSCPRCNETEDLRHKYIHCDYVKRIWQSANFYLNKLSNNWDPQEAPAKRVIAAHAGSTPASMTLIAEILQTITSLRSEQEYLLHPKFIARRAIKNISIKEGNKKLKDLFIEALNDEEIV